MRDGDEVMRDGGKLQKQANAQFSVVTVFYAVCLISIPFLQRLNPQRSDVERLTKLPAPKKVLRPAGIKSSGCMCRYAEWK